MEILKYCTDCDEIQFKEDGSWAPMRSKKEAQEVTTSFNGVEGERHNNSSASLNVFPLCCFVYGSQLFLR